MNCKFSGLRNPCLFHPYIPSNVPGTQQALSKHVLEECVTFSACVSFVNNSTERNRVLVVCQIHAKSFPEFTLRITLLRLFFSWLRAQTLELVCSCLRTHDLELDYLHLYPRSMTF